MAENDAPLNKSATLTDWEWKGLHTEYNLADAHAHYRLPGHFTPLVSRLTNILQTINDRTQIEYEKEFASAFFALAGQSLPASKPTFHYSSSVSIEMAGKVLAITGKRRIAVLSPTFDNIPLLLRRAGLEVMPLRQEELAATGRLPPWVTAECDAVFLVLPNNPTGWLPTQFLVRSVADQLAQARRTLVVDFSFRFYTDLHRWDQYRLVADTGGLDWILLEDTGKTWATAEMKVCICSCSEVFQSAMELVTGELLLNVSPFTLALITGLAKLELSDRGMAGSRQLVCAQLASGNRRLLRSLLDGLPVRYEPAHTAISVEWLHLPGTSAIELCNYLSATGVSVLPGNPFYWDDRARGDSYIRVALARDGEYFSRAADVLRQGLTNIFSRKSSPPARETYSVEKSS